MPCVPFIKSGAEGRAARIQQKAGHDLRLSMMDGLYAECAIIAIERQGVT